MSADNNRDYFSDRAIAARNLAEQAADPSIAQIHRQMAQEYEHRAALRCAGTALKLVRD